jgi:hypothetical protein
MAKVSSAGAIWLKEHELRQDDRKIRSIQVSLSAEAIQLRNALKGLYQPTLCSCVLNSQFEANSGAPVADRASGNSASAGALSWWNAGRGPARA